jgi:S1-C subfamily serine protease
MDVQIAGQINPGNSGGPVVDTNGRLVGVAVGHVRDKNLGFAIPTTQVAHMFNGAVLGGFLYQLRRRARTSGSSGSSGGSTAGTGSMTGPT